MNCKIQTEEEIVDVSLLPLWRDAAFSFHCDLCFGKDNKIIRRCLIDIIRGAEEQTEMTALGYIKTEHQSQIVSTLAVNQTKDITVTTIKSPLLPIVCTLIE